MTWQEAGEVGNRIIRLPAGGDVDFSVHAAVLKNLSCLT